MAKITLIFSAFRCTDSKALSTISPSRVVSTATSVLLTPPLRTVLSETCWLICCTVEINSAASLSCSTKDSELSSLERLTMPSSIKSSMTDSLLRPVASATTCARSSNSKSISSSLSDIFCNCLFCYFNLCNGYINFEVSIVLSLDRTPAHEALHI